jgi:hypothetical protein
MTTSFADASQGRGPANRILTLTGLFWAFSYVLLSIRGAIYHDDWTKLIDDNRLLAVSVGAGAYFLVLRQLQAGHRITLRGAIGWIAVATLTVMIVRLTVDELIFDVPQGIEVNLLWSLTWSAYFALWVMGSLAFAPRMKIDSVAFERLEAFAPPADQESLELLIEAIVAEADTLEASDRSRLIRKILALGAYETIEGPTRDNERARLALRLAARLSAS